MKLFGVTTNFQNYYVEYLNTSNSTAMSKCSGKNIDIGPRLTSLINWMKTSKPITNYHKLPDIHTDSIIQN